jgi:hypothetical protein
MYDDKEKKPVFKTENKTLIFFTVTLGIIMVSLVLFLFYEVYKHPEGILGSFTKMLPSNVQTGMENMQQFNSKAQDAYSSVQNVIGKGKRYVNQVKETSNSFQQTGQRNMQYYQNYYPYYYPRYR